MVSNIQTIMEADALFYWLDGGVVYVCVCVCVWEGGGGSFEAFRYN